MMVDLKGFTLAATLPDSEYGSVYLLIAPGTPGIDPASIPPLQQALLRALLLEALRRLDGESQ